MTEDEDHLFWACPAWNVVRSPQVLLLTTEVPWLPEDPSEWPPCRRLRCLPPAHLFKGATTDVTSRFVETLLTMFCRILRMRLGRERLQECLFNRPEGTQRAYPFGELYGPKPRPSTGGEFVINEIPASKWRWEAAFRVALLSWLRELQWEPGLGQVTFAELVLDFEAHSGRAMPASPGAELQSIVLSARRCRWCSGTWCRVPWCRAP